MFTFTVCLRVLQAFSNTVDQDNTFTVKSDDIKDIKRA